MGSVPRDGGEDPARAEGPPGHDAAPPAAAWRWIRRLERAQASGLVVFLLLALGLSFPYFEKTRNANE